jgi:hypothetical protein
VESVAPSGVPVIARNVAANLRGQDRIELRLDGVHYATDAPARSFDAPSLLVSADFHAGDGGGERDLVLGVELKQAAVVLENHHLTIEGLDESLRASWGIDALDGEVALKEHLAVRSAVQDWTPVYAVGDLVLDARAARYADGSLRLERLDIHNPLGGTTVEELRGSVDHELLAHKDRRLAGRRSVSLKGKIKQDLDRLRGAAAGFEAAGKVKLDFDAQSGDMVLFRTEANVEIEQGKLKLPRRGISLEGIEGKVPLIEDVLLKDWRHPTVVSRGEDNAYPQLRFADQHPFLGEHSLSFIAVDKVTHPRFSGGPLAGNLRIVDKVLSLDQLEMEVRGGRVTGQVIIETDYPNSHDADVQLHLRASNILDTRNDPFDGNLAVVFSLKKRTIDGRAEIIRLNRGHLFDLLDLWDPHRSDVQVNRLRQALGYGYPERVRLTFDRGLANLLVTLGGLGSVVRVSEVRGYPAGHMIDKYVDTIFPTEETP